MSGGILLDQIPIGFANHGIQYQDVIMSPDNVLVQLLGLALIAFSAALLLGGSSKEKDPFRW